jgi:predicted RNase H-like HicB family nuclease
VFKSGGASGDIAVINYLQEDFMSYTAYIEKDHESGMFIGSVPGLSGAHTCAVSIDELQDKLKEVIALCLEEMSEEDIKGLPVFAGISQIEVAV